MLSISTIAVVLYGCRDVIEPLTATKRPSSASLGGTEGHRGCGRFEIGPASHGELLVTELEPRLTETCGALKIRVVSAIPTALGARVSVTITNGGLQTLGTPAALYAWEDSLAVSSPPGLARNKHTATYLTLLHPDSAVSATAEHFASALVWMLDSSLAPSGQPQELTAGATSLPRSIDIQIKNGVRSFRIGLWATASRKAPPVPAVPPDTIPMALYDDENLVIDDRKWGTPFMRDIIAVRFVLGATQPERQEAVDAVRGTVVGGKRVHPSDGFYVIRLPRDSTPDQQAMFAAVAALKALPQVSVAALNWVMKDATTHLRPNDGTGMQKADWRLDPDAAFGNPARRTWALEAVNAPLAWGCSTGGMTRVGVIDMGIHSNADLMPNLAPGQPAFHTDTFTHGTNVASVIAARGNDGAGMTGMMWRAQLELRDVSARRSDGTPETALIGGRVSEIVDMVAVGTTIVELLNANVRVINISLGRNGLQNASPTPVEDALRRNHAGTIAGLLTGRSPAQRPLWVISAGNMEHAGDTYWSIMTATADSIPDEALIVTGAATTAGALQAHATGTGNVHIAAPGENVTVMSPAGVIGTGTGASFATPLVSGAAGLLFGFDPSLTAVEVRRYLLAGANSGGRRAGPYPIVDAYESLRLAATRVGAPICGNRLFVDGGRLFVDRAAPGATTLIDDPIDANLSPGGLAILGTFHGGRHIYMRDFSSDWDVYLLTHHNGQWTRLPPSQDSIDALVPTFTRPGTTSAVTHDGDSVVFGVQKGNPGPTFRIVARALTNNAQERTITTLPGVLTGLALPMIGNEVLVAVSPTFGLAAQTVYAVNLTSGALRAVATRPVGSPSTVLTGSENGREFMLSYSTPYPSFARCITEIRLVARDSVLRRMDRPNNSGACEGNWPQHALPELRVP